ncbi:MAG: hypothetical protein ACI4BD_00580 [Paludibacteraceae bacterium]
MKKIFTTILCLSMAFAAQAALHLSFFDENGEEWEVTNDTTIDYTAYEEDEFGDISMQLNGNISSDDSQDFVVVLTRSTAGIEDQLCLNQCTPGNGELTQTMEFPALPGFPTKSWYAHYIPTEEGTVTIAYAFSDKVNPTITLTVNYTYNTTATEQVKADSAIKGIFTVLGQRIAATSIDELPKGIYIVNGKKVIHQ